MNTLTKRTKRTRRPTTRGPVVANPSVTTGTIDGEPVVYVPLSGNGFNRQMIVDADRWPMVVDLWGKSWGLVTPGIGYAYVASARAAVGPLAGQKGSLPVAYLARLLTNADRDHVVRFNNEDSLDLRDSNLRVLTRAEARRWSVAMQAFLDSFDVAA